MQVRAILCAALFASLSGALPIELRRDAPESGGQQIDTANAFQRRDDPANSHVQSFAPEERSNEESVPQSRSNSPRADDDLTDNRRVEHVAAEGHGAPLSIKDTPTEGDDPSEGYPPTEEMRARDIWYHTTTTHPIPWDGRGRNSPSKRGWDGPPNQGNTVWNGRNSNSPNPGFSPFNRFSRR